MTINTKQKVSSCLIENPLLKYDGCLTRQIFLMEHPEYKADAKENLEKYVKEFEKAKETFQANAEQSKTHLGELNLRITEYENKPFILKIIEAIVSFIFNTPDALAAWKESQREWTTAHDHSQKGLQMVNDDLRIAKMYLQESDPELNNAIADAKTQIARPNFWVKINGFRCDTSNVLEKLEKVAPGNDIRKFVLLKLATQSLDSILKQIIEDALFQSNGVKYQVEHMDPTREISIETNIDGALEISVKTRFNAKGPRSEFLHLESTIRVPLNAKGTVENAIVRNEIVRAPEPHLSTALSTKIQDDYCKAPKASYTSIQLDDEQTPVCVSKEVVKDCARQIDCFAIDGCEPIAKKRQAQRAHLKKLTQKFVEENRTDPQGERAKALDKESSALKESLEQDILQDFLKAIRDKLGPDRQHLLPTVTNWFAPIATGPLKDLIHMHYNQITQQIGDDEQSYTLNIPEDRRLPITITCVYKRFATDKQGKNDLFEIEARGVYTIHPDGRVSLKGEVTNLHELSL